MPDLCDIALTQPDPEWHPLWCPNCRRKDEALRAAKQFILDCCDCSDGTHESICRACQLSALITATLEEHDA